ncbi:hypothetical protein AcW1_007647 [Taiwanofungus camphoratus]|nr:hypothetical protein AcW2_007293 [Antrodia cinnamomea]KAI0926982.1 hypothetical protein AcV5_007634 [Antrodia cinnamomea]KAI0947413.1 hypothetical protein AcV7_009850 [Antrodia cinnamomea]KAI0953423.1 hypothetical protein AcW1_007647 [Antrodia cinnamomea]
MIDRGRPVNHHDDPQTIEHITSVQGPPAISIECGETGTIVRPDDAIEKARERLGPRVWLAISRRILGGQMRPARRWGGDKASVSAGGSGCCPRVACPIGPIHTHYQIENTMRSS